MHLKITYLRGISAIHWLYPRVPFDRQLGGHLLSDSQFRFSVFSFLVLQVRELATKAHNDLGLSVDTDWWAIISWELLWKVNKPEARKELELEIKNISR